MADNKTIEKKIISTQIHQYKVSLIDEPAYNQNSLDTVRGYRSELCRPDADESCCAHGVIAGDIISPETSTIILGTGGATGVHENSIAHTENICFIAAGDSVFALEVPSLKMLWCKKVDLSSCFGVFWVEKQGCLITWGEIFVCRFSMDGNKIWKTSGADIFTQRFELAGDAIEVIDFNNDKYRINIRNGKIDKQ
jgi:hypothetical protein